MIAITDLGASDGPQEPPLREQLLDGLSDTAAELQYAGTPFAHRRSFPTGATSRVREPADRAVLLYDDPGLSIYDEITRVKEYCALGSIRLC